MGRSALAEFFFKYWFQFLLTLISGGLTALCRKFYMDAKAEKKKMEEEEKERRKRQKLMEDALKAILHDRLLSLLTHYLNAGEISTNELDNVKALYKAYAGLEGNGTIKVLYERMEHHCKITAPAYVENFV